jgi:hypothetical protein
MNTARVATACIIPFFALLSRPVPADEAPQWNAGLAAAKITPQKPVRMAGYANRVRPFESVEQDIYAKALAIEDQSGHRAVLITMDLIGLASDVAEPVAQRITEKTKIARPDILFSYAHNHAGPEPSLTAKPGIGTSAEDAANTVAYTRWLQEQLIELAAKAAADMRPVTLAWSTGVVNFPMNRREFTAGGVILGRNPRGPSDRAVPVLRVGGPDHKPIAVVFGCACHNTTLTGQNYALCGDYAGFAEHEIQAALPGAQAMFVTGCAGDADPYPRGKMDDAKQNGHELATEVVRVVGTQLKPVNGPLHTAFDYAELPLKPMKRQELEAIVAAKKPGYLLPTATRMLAMLDKGEPLPTSHRAPLAVWQFGRDLTLIALSGEVVVDYAYLIEKSIGPLNLWPAAYCNDYFGYLPSKRVITEGGYETRGLHDGSGFFAPEAEDTFVAKVHELAEEAGREIPAK